MPVEKRLLLNSILIFLLSLGVFTVGLSSQEVIAFDTRFYLFAQEMWRQGVSWFPTSYGLSYPDYPGTSTWMIYGLAKLFGGLSKLIAVMPTAFFAALTLVFTYLIGSQQSTRQGLAAVFMLFLTLIFIRTARSISLDMMITAVTTMVFYFVHTKRMAVVYLLLLIGFALRGPIGLVIPAGVMCIYFACARQYQLMITRGFAALMMLMVCTIILLGLAFHIGGLNFVRDVLQMQVLGRLDQVYLPRYFYITNSFGSYAAAYPLAWLVLLSVGLSHLQSLSLRGRFLGRSNLKRDCFDAKNAPRNDVNEITIIVLTAWMLVVLLGLSIPADKKVRYVMPMLPACALIASYLYAETPITALALIKKILSILFFCLPLICMLSVLWIWRMDQLKSLSLSLHYVSILAIFIILTFFLVGLVIKYKLSNDLPLMLLAMAAVTFNVYYLTVIEPIQLHVDRSRSIVQSIETMRLKDHAKLVFYREGTDGLPIKYIINMPHYEKPLFVTHAADLQSLKQSVYVVMSEEYANDMHGPLQRQFHQVMQTKLAHVNIVVFKGGNAHPVIARPLLGRSNLG